MADPAAVLFLFFFNDTATTEIYTLSLHDALPISAARGALDRRGRELLLRLRHVRLHLASHLLQVAHVLHHSISMIRSGRRNVSSAARSIGSSAGDGASAGSVCTTQRARTVRLRRSESPCSSSTR